jgi:hypothetical protein
MPATIRPLFNKIDDWLLEIEETTKSAAAKPAPAKPGTKKAGVKKAGPSGMGETSHPSEDVDNNTQDEETGERYEENSADVKKDVPGQAVDETDPKSGGDQDDKQYNIGTQQSSTGEDPSVEDDYKGDKDDPGTDHPMNADDVGEKYSSMHLKKLLKVAEDKAHNILADLANGIAEGTGQTVSQKVAAVKAAAPAATPAPAPQTAAAAGYDASTQTVEMEKLAEDFVAQTVRDADLDADLTGAFILSYHQSRQKRAADEAGEGEDHSENGGGGDASGGDAPPTDGAGGDAPPGGGGGDVLSALGAGAGGPPGGDMGGPPGGGMGGPPGAPGAGADPLAGAGGPPPGAAEEGAKLASAAWRYKRSGRFRFEEAKTASQRQARDQIKSYIREITGTR